MGGSCTWESCRLSYYWFWVLLYNWDNLYYCCGCGGCGGGGGGGGGGSGEW